MAVDLCVAAVGYGDALEGTDPALYSASQCAVLAEMLARNENRSAGLRVLLVRRAVDGAAYQQRGFSSPAVWLAHMAGITAGEAKAALATADRLGECDATREALRAGEVSLAQASEIAKTEAASPGAESDLLDLAARRGLSAVRDEGRRRRLGAGGDPEALHRRQRAERRGRTWEDDQGMTGLLAMFTPDVGARVRSRVEAELDGLLRQSRTDGSDATAEQLTADAIANLILDAGTTRRAGGAELVLVCDIAAFQRGHVEGTEMCQVLGGAPVPVSVARDLAGTAAFIKAVLHDGQRVEWVAHYGRYRPAVLQTALGLGPPPLFPGVACVDCGRRHGLQWDHVDPFANGGPTSYENLQARCWPCHRDKTDRDRAAGLLTPNNPRQPGRPKSDRPRRREIGASETDQPQSDEPKPNQPQMADRLLAEPDQPARREPGRPHLANPPPAAA